MSDPSRSRAPTSQRKQLALLAMAPLPASCLFAAAVWPSNLGGAILVLCLTLAFAYFTYLLVALPMLLAFKRFGWLRWYHFAFVGFSSVFLVWLIPKLLVPSAWQPTSVAALAAGLLYPASLAGATGVGVWFVGFRGGRGT
jgi:hypothetical protein